MASSAYILSSYCPNRLIVVNLFGENILGGKVSFATSPDKGTVFSLSLLDSDDYECD
jgi:hypothetical protein